MSEERLLEKYKPYEDVSIERKDDGLSLLSIIFYGIGIITLITLLILGGI